MSFNKIYTVIGARSEGKTPFILGGEYEQGLANVYLKKGMSVLIIDEYAHPKYSHVPFLHPIKYGQLSTKVGMYRTLADSDNMSSLFKHLKNVWNTLIVFEDCFRYIHQKLTKDEIRILGNSKNQNNCLVFMHWCWGFVQKDLFRMTNYYIIFKTSDSPEDRKESVKGCFNQCMNAYDKKLKNKLINGKPYIVVASGI